jgi:capsular polysaccharide biosynthesis protein
MNINFEISILKAIRFENYLAVTAPRGISEKAVELIRSQVDLVRGGEKKRLFRARGASLDRADAALEAAVMERLDDLGFELVNPSTMSVSEQVKLFSSAEIVVGMHGGALANIVWANPGTHVIELFNHPYRTQDFARLAAACKHRYSCIEASDELTDKAVASLIYDIASQS